MKKRINFYLPESTESALRKYASENDFTLSVALQIIITVGLDTLSKADKK